MANLITATSIPHDRELGKLILDRTRYTIDYYGGYFDLLRKFHLNYLSASEMRRKPEPPDMDDGGGEWRSELFVPYTFGTIEAAVPKLVFALFSQRPFVRMIGRDFSDHMKAQKVTSLLDYDMERSEVDYKSVLAFKSFLKYGITIGRVTYRRIMMDKEIEGVQNRPVLDQFGNVIAQKQQVVKTTKQVKLFDGPWYEPVSVFNFFPDPLYYEVEDMRYNSELQLTSISRLQEENEGYKSLTGKNLYSNLDKIKGMPHGEALIRANTWLGDAKEATAAVFGYSDGYNRGIGWMGGPTSNQRHGDEVWLLHYWEPDRYAVLANGTEVIRDGPNPYGDGEMPYFAANCFPIEFEFYGQGMLHPVHGLQEEINAWRMIGIDQGKLNLMKPIAYDPESGLTELDFDIFPGAAVPVPFESGKPHAAPLFPRDTLPPEMWQMESMLLRDWQNALGMNDYVTGGGPGGAGTASEASMITAAAASRFKLQSFIGQRRFLQRLAKKMFARRQQFLDEYEVFRILGDQGYDFPVLGPEDIAGDYDYMPMGSVIGPNKEIERQQMIQFMTVAAGNPIMAQRINWEELLHEFVLTFDFKFPQRFIAEPNQWTIPPQYLERLLQMAMQNDDRNMVEQLIQQIQKQQMEQMMQQGAMPGGQGGSGQNSGTMNQEVGGAGAQGAGQLAAGPNSGAPTMGNLHAQAFGGPGV